ncbi:hypothetical protein BH10PLA2_BH10PLA2_23760 [soil metagenome]
MSIYSTVDFLQAEGERDGRLRGHHEGACRQACKLLLRFGKRAFGPPTDALRGQFQTLSEQGDLDQLERLLNRLPNATGWNYLVPTASSASTLPGPPDYLLPMEVDLTPVGPSIDQYAKMSLFAGKEVVIHLRFQRMYQKNLGEVLYKESRRLRGEGNLEVMTAVTLLWPGADGPDVTGEFRTGKEVFRYQLVRLWEKDADEILAKPGMAMFAPLSRFAPERLPEILQRMSEKIAEQTDKETRENMWSIVYFCMGLIHPAERVHELLPHLLAQMRTRPDGRSMLSRGYYAGHSTSLAEGALATTRRFLFKSGTARLLEPTPALRQTLSAITNLERLEQIAARIQTAQTWQESLTPG